MTQAKGVAETADGHILHEAHDAVTRPKARSLATEGPAMGTLQQMELYGRGASPSKYRAAWLLCTARAQAKNYVFSTT